MQKVRRQGRCIRRLRQWVSKQQAVCGARCVKHCDLCCTMWYLLPAFYLGSMPCLFRLSRSISARRFQLNLPSPPPSLPLTPPATSPPPSLPLNPPLSCTFSHNLVGKGLGQLLLNSCWREALVASYAWGGSQTNQQGSMLWQQSMVQIGYVFSSESAITKNWIIQNGTHYLFEGNLLHSILFCDVTRGYSAALCLPPPPVSSHRTHIDAHTHARTYIRTRTAAHTHMSSFLLASR